MLFFNHMPLVIENYRRILHFSGVNFTDSTNTFKTPTGAGERDRVSGECHLWHLSGAFLNDGWKTNNIKEENVWWIFDLLGSHFHEILGSREKHVCGCWYCSIICSGGYIYCSRGDWQFKLIVSVDSPQKKYYYTPRSYFHVSVDRLMYFLVEVQSDENQSDQYQMLLHAACAARLGYLSYNNPFIVVALYIENTGRVALILRYACLNPSNPVFSHWFLLGFLRLGRPRLDATVYVVYGYIRSIQPCVDDTNL